MKARLIIRSIGTLFILLGTLNFVLKFFGSPPIQIPGDILSIISIIGGIRLLCLKESGRKLIGLLSLVYAALATIYLIIGLIFPSVRYGEIIGQRIESQTFFWGYMILAFVIFGSIYALLRTADAKKACE